MSFLPSLQDLLHRYGAPGVGLVLMLESIGLPLPGESLMIAAAVYAATTGQIDIWTLVPIAAAGAIVGDQIGYGIGRWIGFRLLAHWGRKVGLSEDRLELGRYLFSRYGGAVVFFGRFVALLRTFAAVLAGANRMPWHRFLPFNVAGGALWAALYGLGGFFVGEALHRLAGVFGIGFGVVAAAAMIAGWVFLKRHGTRLADAAERALPGPLATAPPAT